LTHVVVAVVADGVDCVVTEQRQATTRRAALRSTQRLARHTLALVASLAGVALHTPKGALERLVAHDAPLASKVDARPSTLASHARADVVARDEHAEVQRRRAGVAADGTRGMASLCTAYSSTPPTSALDRLTREACEGCTDRVMREDTCTRPHDAQWHSRVLHASPGPFAALDSVRAWSAFTTNLQLSLPVHQSDRVA
jgi:hypothetical protein